MTNRRIQAAESTEYPWWAVIDPTQLMDIQLDRGLYGAAGMFTGPFFSRERAQRFLDATRYNFSERARVFCMSGHKSRDWREFCKEDAGSDIVATLDTVYPEQPKANRDDPAHGVRALAEEVASLRETHARLARILVEHERDGHIVLTAEDRIVAALDIEASKQTEEAPNADD